MNSQLIDSLVKVVQALSAAEQQELITKLNGLVPSAESNEPMTSPSPSPAEHPEAWDLFLALGENATPGKLENPSINHDHYLYQQP